MMRKYLRDFYKAGGTDEGLESSIKSIDPLSGLNEEEQMKFIRSLNADERAALRNAIKFAEKVKARFGF